VFLPADHHHLPVIILLLEDFGYMARAAFLMDRIMGGAGLHGRAFIPLCSRKFRPARFPASWRRA